MRSGEPLTQLVEFTSGFPDGNIAWSLVDGDGTAVTSGSVTPAVGSVSAMITVSGTHNTLSGGALYGYRELSWNYLVGGVRIANLLRYRVEAFLKFGVSDGGVRQKLGVEDKEIEADEVDLVIAYSTFENTVGAVALAAVTDPYLKLLIGNAIEALAALRILPTLQVKLAQKEVSGTSQYARAKIDWAELTARLNEMVAAGYLAVDPAFDVTANYGSIFQVVVRSPDPITGSAPV